MEDPGGSYRTTDLEEHEVKAGLQQFAQSTPTGKAGSSGTAGLPKQGGSSNRAAATFKNPNTAETGSSGAAAGLLRQGGSSSRAAATFKNPNTTKAGSSGTAAGLINQGGRNSRAASTLKKPKTANVDKTQRSEMRKMSSSASARDDDEDDFA